MSCGKDFVQRMEKENGEVTRKSRRRDPCLAGRSLEVDNFRRNRRS